MAVAARERWQVVSVPCEWQACLDKLARGEIDLMPDVAFTEQRAQQFDFHETPALLSWSQIYKRKDVSIRAITDLGGKRIAVVAGSIQAPFLQNLLGSFGVAATLVYVDSFEQGFEQVRQRNADAVAANRFFGDLQALASSWSRPPSCFSRCNSITPRPKAKTGPCWLPLTVICGLARPD